MNTFSRETLLGISQNDSSMKILSLGCPYTGEEGEFNSSKCTDFAKLGVAIGKNNNLIEMDNYLGDNSALDVSNRDFYDGLKQNTSITTLTLFGRLSGVGCEILKTFQENNNLTKLSISGGSRSLDESGCRVLIKALRKCTNLKFIELYNCNITDKQLVHITKSVREHLLLKEFKLGINRVGNVGCEALVTALLNGPIINNLQTLDLQGNNIATTGCEALATLLRNPNCNLNTIVLSGNAIDDVGATTIISSLANNTKLHTLYLNGNQIDRSIQSAFLGLICNTSSINSTHLSNHTLEKIALRDGTQTRLSHRDLYEADNTPELLRLLKLNKIADKRHVAIRKILQYHPNIDMSPLFSLDIKEDDKNLKALPYVIDWFERAREALSGSDVRQCCTKRSVESRKLSSIYQFAGAMPLLFVLPTSNHKQRRKRKRKRVYGKVQLLVRGFGSGTHAVDISLLDNVESLQAKLESKTGITPVGHVMFVCNGKRLEKGNTLNDSGCTNGSTVQASFLGW